MLKRQNTAKVATAAAPSPRLMYAKYRGVCKCGRGFIAGEQIEFDPADREKRCIRCVARRRAQTGIAGQVLDFDSYRGVVQRLKAINEMDRPLSPSNMHEYWNLMQEISTAPETSKSVKQFLQSTAKCCKSSDSERFVVTLDEDKPCVHCFQMQKRGELALMEFPSRNVHCIWCECTHV